MISGGAALHHTILSQIGPELSRLLKPRGKGAFQEPLGHNWLLEFARDNLQYRGKHPEKGTDKPLLLDDIDQFGSHFVDYHYRSFNLLAALPTLAKIAKPLRPRLERWDNRLFSIAPYLQRWTQYVAICVTN